VAAEKEDNPPSVKGALATSLGLLLVGFVLRTVTVIPSQMKALALVSSGFLIAVVVRNLTVKSLRESKLGGVLHLGVVVAACYLLWLNLRRLGWLHD